MSAVFAYDDQPSGSFVAGVGSSDGVATVSGVGAAGATEEIQDGTFDVAPASSPWNPGANTNIANNRLEFTPGAGITTQDITSLIDGLEYTVQFQINVSAGAVKINFGGTQTAEYGTGTYSVDLILGTNHNTFRVVPNSLASGWVDNISVKLKE